MNKRCCDCGSSHSFFDKSMNREHWYRDDEKYLCNNCYQRRKPKKPNKTFKFDGKAITAKSVPRKGICTEHDDGTKHSKTTSLHHFYYDKKHPLDYTIELCQKCHNLTDRLSGAIKGHEHTGKNIPCDNCGKEIYVIKFYLATRKHHYCSKECADKGHSKFCRQGIYVSCEECGKKIYRQMSFFKRYKHHFCSRDCKGKGVVKYRKSRWDKRK